MNRDEFLSAFKLITGIEVKEDEVLKVENIEDFGTVMVVALNETELVFKTHPNSDYDSDSCMYGWIPYDDIIYGRNKKNGND